MYKKEVFGFLFLKTHENKVSYKYKVSHPKNKRKTIENRFFYIVVF